MCGFAGFAGIGDADILRRMTDRLAHRGPDGEGFYLDDALKVGLGHRRLSIIDIDGGAQPMWNADHSIGLIFNGEIYNHLDLRAELIAAGHKFQSDHSDSEVLVHGYAEWGEGLPAKLNGMFAFVILDRRRGRLFFARDRFGEKPFYYAEFKGGFAFASELSALKLHPSVDQSADPLGMQKLLGYGYIPAPWTSIRGAKKLEAGAWLSYDIASGVATVQSYWRFELTPDEALTDDREDALAEELRALLMQAVSRRMMSDVPLGVFLSGGLDSSTALIGATEAAGRGAVRTFTVGFTDPSFDESPYARQVAEAFGSIHREHMLDIELAGELIPGVLGALDEPLGDASLLPTYLLAKFTREHVTVALSGDGGDELFAGYDPFVALNPATLYDRFMPRAGHALAQYAAARLPRSDKNMSLDFKVRRTLGGLSYPWAMRNPIWMAPLDPKEWAAVFDAPMRPEDVYGDAMALWERDPKLDTVDRTLEFFTRFYLSNDILTKVDRAAMMVSLESRAVFLDNDVVAFCQRLPNRFKYRNGVRKYLLKKAIARDLPPAILNRPKKGFGIPVSKWLRSIPAEPPLAPIEGFRMPEVARRWAEHRANKADNRLFLWNWMSLQHSRAAA